MPDNPADWPPIIQAIGAALVLIIGAIASAIVLVIKSHADTRRQIASVAADAAAVRVTTTTTNSGSHLLDKIDELGNSNARIETEQKRQAAELARLADQHDATASDLRGIRRDIGRLHDTDREDRERAAAAHKDLWSAIKSWASNNSQ